MSSKRSSFSFWFACNIGGLCDLCKKSSINNWFCWRNGIFRICYFLKSFLIGHFLSDNLESLMKSIHWAGEWVQQKWCTFELKNTLKIVLQCGCLLHLPLPKCNRGPTMWLKNASKSLFGNILMPFSGILFSVTPKASAKNLDAIRAFSSPWRPVFSELASSDSRSGIPFSVTPPLFLADSGFFL